MVSVVLSPVRIVQKFQYRHWSHLAQAAIPCDTIPVRIKFVILGKRVNFWSFWDRSTVPSLQTVKDLQSCSMWNLG
jgi:hypothetical protein